jgi:hypothetical protein
MNNEEVNESLEDKILIPIPRDLYDAIKRRVELSQGDFKSIEEYVEFVLREVVKEEEETKPVYSPEEEEEIKKRLRGLGYL